MFLSGGLRISFTGQSKPTSNHPLDAHYDPIVDEAQPS